MNRHVANRVSSELASDLRQLGCGEANMDSIKHRHYRRLQQLLQPGGAPLLVIGDLDPARQYIDEAGYGPEWDECYNSSPTTAIAISRFLAIVRQDRDHDSDVFDVADLDCDLPAIGRSLDVFV